MFNNAMGIDLGTASVLIYRKGKGVVLNEPSVVAVDENTNKVIAVGRAAQRMIGRTPPGISAVHPLAGGVISSLTRTEAMINALLTGVLKKYSSNPVLMMCVPSGITDVEQRAVIETARQIGAKEIYIIEEAMAAALGAGADVTKARGAMVVDIGGGTTDIAVISVGQVIAGRSIKIAGDSFTDALIRFMRKEYNLALGETTAEYIKAEIGCAMLPEQEKSVVARGSSIITGLPKGIVVSSTDICPAFDELVNNIIERIKDVLEETPVRLQADILTDGIMLTGGGALLHNLDKRITEECGVPARVCDHAVECVVRGAGKALDHINRQDRRFFKKAYIQN